MLNPLALRPRLQSADFQQALATRPVARSAHFAVHFAVPTAPPAVLRRQALATNQAAQADAVDASTPDLSTARRAEPVQPVDEWLESPLVWRLGLVLPKRMARRSVTRSLIKHQARELWRLHAPQLLAAGWLTPGRPVGNWVLRLRAPLAKQDFPSAASPLLTQCVRGELLAMLGTLSANKGRA